VAQDISFAVGRQSQFCEEPTNEDWSHVKHILRYLKKTANYGLHYVKTGQPIEAWVDADWANDVQDARSISGYVIKMAGGAVSWTSRKQTCVASSTTHAEYMALYDVITEIIWMKSLLVELGQAKFANSPIIVHVDNMGAIRIAESNQVTERSKHFNVKFHLVRDEIKKGTMMLSHTNSKDNVADLFTKPLSGVLTQNCSVLIGVKPIE